MTRRLAAAAISCAFGLQTGLAQRSPDLSSSTPPARTLGDAPMRVGGISKALVSAQSQIATPFLATPSLSVDTSIRRASRNFFNAVYSASNGIPADWTGDESTGDEGDTSQDFKDAVVLRVNALRAFAGTPAAITLNSTWSGQDQQAALMMSANNQLNHHPPSSWTYYTAQGAQAASSSDLALGEYGPDAITGYIEDPGSNNTVVGHRRWVLYPPTQTMGTGDIPPNGTHPSANALWVFDSAHTYPALRDGFVAWPPKGYVPYLFIYPRWSFSLANANFAGAAVSVTRNGTNVATTIISSINNGYGDNTLIWTLAGAPDGSGAFPAPTSDITYNVAVSNVIVGGVAHSYTYSVIAFDPSVSSSDDILPTFSGPSTVTAGSTTNLAFTSVPEASGYDIWSATLQTAMWTDGAETTPYHLIAETTGSYSFVNSATSATGSKSFQLCQDQFNNQDLVLNSSFVASASSSLSFKSRFGYMTSTQVARVQVSLDDGVSWTSVYSRAGTSSDSGSFSQQSVSLAAYANRIIRIRFLLDFTGGSAFTQTGQTNVGWLIDDITPVNLEETSAVTENSLSSGPYSFTAPGQSSTTHLAARAVLFGSFPLEYGPVADINVSQPSTQPAITSTTTASGQVGSAFGGYTVTATSTGSPTTFSATGLPAGISLNGNTGVVSGTPTHAGIFTVSLRATNSTTSEFGTAALTITIAKGAASVSVGAQSLPYNGAGQSASATTTPSGLAVTYTYNGSATLPVAVGSYNVVATISDANYAGSGTGTLVITKGIATIQFDTLALTYTGKAQGVTATTTPASLPVTFTYNGKAALPVNAGSYVVGATVNTASAAGSATGTLTISPATGTVTLSNLNAVYSGRAIAATAVTNPARLAVNLTYDSVATAPILTGTYTVVGLISNANYAGSSTGNLVISPVLPLATTAAALPIGARTATLNATINPKGSATSVVFEYGLTTAYGVTTGSTTVAAGTANVNAAYGISGLLPQTTYHYHVIAANAAGSLIGADKTLTTLAVPVLTDNPVSYLAASGAQVTQTVNPEGLALTVYFEYGTTTGYGSQTAQKAVTGKTDVTVFAAFSGLTPGTLYHYRMVTVSAAGVVNGVDHTFTTLGFDTTLVAQNGDAAIVPGTTFSVLGNPIVNEHDAVAFKSTIIGTGLTAANNIGIFAEDNTGTRTIAARLNDAAPDTTGTFAALGDPVFNNNAAVAFTGNLKVATNQATRTNSLGVWSTGSGAPALVARQGFQAPDCAMGVLFGGFNSVGLSDAGTVIIGTLTTNAALGVSAANNLGVWEGDTQNDLALVLRTGQSVGGKTISGLTFLSAQPLVGGQTRSFAGNTGDIVTLAAFTDKTTGLVKVVVSPSVTPTLLAAAGDSAADTGTATFTSFRMPIMNNNDHVAFAATLVTSGTTTAANNSGIWADTSAGVRHLVARAGDLAPGTTAAFVTLGDPVCNASESVAFNGTLKVAAGQATNTTANGIWCKTGGTLTLVARQGSLAAGCPAGATFATFTSLALTDTGVTFVGTINVNALAGVSSANNTGIWAVDDSGNLQLIVRTGDVLNGKTVTALSFLPAAGVATSGQTRSFSQQGGDLIYSATFSDKSTAIFNVVFP